jgi:unsaturated chondroitin disaccharide hydrolase
MINTFKLVCLMILPGALSCNSNIEKEKVPLNFNIDQIILMAEEKYTEAVSSLSVNKRMPRNANADGTWKTVPLKDWTSGFFPGILWQLYDYTKKEYWREEALEWTWPLAELKDFDGHHDLGFMIFCSFGNAYKLTGEPGLLDVIVQSAETLSTRFRPEVGTILSWGDIHEQNPEIHQTIIDNMMNLELLLWVADKTHNKELENIAITHANTTMANHFRKDNSTYHVVVYDPKNGNVLNKRTHQGYRDDSMWARGQSWAIYGYTMMYRETGISEYLKQAMKAADCYISRLPDDIIPYWDFDAPNIPDEPKDASSAAIASSALIELYQVSGKLKYYNAAVRLLNKLSSEDYLAVNDNYQCLLLHSVGNKNTNSEVDENIIYADYYYLEALNRLNYILSDNEQAQYRPKSSK